ncbi:MAG: hypothetical protein JWM61_1016, partial [Micrococcaceae bacterium]|nr:hypothetical protein [Micrococcaceae bacterium]
MTTAPTPRAGTRTNVQKAALA